MRTVDGLPNVTAAVTVVDNAKVDGMVDFLKVHWQADRCLL